MKGQQSIKGLFARPVEAPLLPCGDTPPVATAPLSTLPLAATVLLPNQAPLARPGPAPAASPGPPRGLALGARPTAGGGRPPLEQYPPGPAHASPLRPLREAPGVEASTAHGHTVSKRRRSRAAPTPGGDPWPGDEGGAWCASQEEEGCGRVGWARDSPNAKRLTAAPPRARDALPAPGVRPSALQELLGLAVSGGGQGQGGSSRPRPLAAPPAWEQWIAPSPARRAPQPAAVAEGEACGAAQPGSAAWRLQRSAEAITPGNAAAAGAATRRTSAPTPGSRAAEPEAAGEGVPATGHAPRTGGAPPGGRATCARSVGGSSRRRQRNAALLSLLDRAALTLADGGAAENEGERAGSDAESDSSDAFQVDPLDLAAMLEVAALPSEALTATQHAAARLARPQPAAQHACSPGPRAPLQPLSQGRAGAEDAAADVCMAEVGDDFGADFCVPPPPPGVPLRVLSVADETPPDGGGVARRVRLRYECAGGSGSAGEYLLWLRCGWAETPLSPGDSVALSCEWSPWGDAELGGRSAGHLVLHPHTLLSATVVGAALACTRRAALNERLGGGAPSAASAFGTATHALFQATLQAPGDAAAAAAAAAPRVTAAAAPQLAACGESCESLGAHLARSAPGLSAWVQAARGPRGVPAACARTQAPSLLRLDAIEDIEQMLWSPRLGLKGQLDATVLCRLAPSGQPTRAPFELKTGAFRSEREHGAQVALYTALLGDCQGAGQAQGPAPFGLLHYSAPDRRGAGAGDTRVVAPTAGERASLMQARNALAAALQRAQLPGGALPPVAAPASECARCYKLQECALADAALEGRGAAGAAPESAALLAPHVSHLTAQAAAFLRHWDAILGAEVAALSTRAAAPWLAEGEVRARGGACLTGLALALGDAALLGPERYAAPPDSQAPPRDPHPEEEEDGGEGLLQYAFTLPPAGPCAAPRLLPEGERVLLSLAPQSPLAPPSDVAVLCRAVVAGTRLQDGCLQLLLHTSKRVRLPPGCAGPTAARWRLDRDDGPGLVTRMRGVLWEAMSQRGSTRLRELVAELAAPRTREPAPAPPPHAPGAQAAAALTACLNDEQRVAVDALLGAGDYALLRGLPGTGKTATLCAIAAQLVSRGARVLLCAHTHVAVDAAVVRLLQAGVPGVLRLGDPGRVHPQARAACVWQEEPRLVALTASACASPASPLLRLPPGLRRFHVCLLDEAAQTPLPLALAPLQRADAWLLAGDSEQLAPLWTAPGARAGGGEESLFARLAAAHPQALVSLRRQYRMGAHIMALANRLVYRGELACGDAAVAGRQLALQVPLPPSAPHWLAQALRPERSVLLLDTDALGARCAATARPLRNVGEALVCARLATALYRSAALSHGQLLLLTPYNAQVEALREALAAADCDAEASTVDRAQGRDVPAVILSATATLPLPRSDLLAEQRRLCVALTRAQAKLIIVGSAAALRGAPLTQRLVEECDARGWTLQLPADALE